MLSFHVKFVQTGRQMDRQTDNGKTICPRSFDAGGGGGGGGGHKNKIKNNNVNKVYNK